MFCSFLQPTKTAKQRRHLINLEIDHIRSLLPLKDRSRQRLSQIEAITMACMFIRKNHYLGSSEFTVFYTEYFFCFLFDNPVQQSS